MPTIAAMAFKFSLGQPFVYPDNELDYTANFLNYDEYVKYEPSEGSLLLFPTFFEHQVEPNNSNEDRISVSFNLSLTHEKV